MPFLDGRTERADEDGRVGVSVPAPNPALPHTERPCRSATLRPALPPAPVSAPLVQQIDRLAAGIQLLREQLTTLDAHVAAPVRPTLLSPEEAAAELGVGRSTVYRLMDAGELRRVHIGKCTRIPRADLDRYVARLLGESA